jgi:glycyl-tRNA synthetase
MVLRLDHRLAPVKAAVLPLSKTDALLPTAQSLAAELRQFWNVDYDETQSIGKRYRRQDEVGTPFCITVDFDTIEDQAVTIRARDTMTQDRVALGKVKGYLAERLVGG